jgi:hypothetical protein
MIVLNTSQRIVATANGYQESRDFSSYDQVPLGPRDLVWDGARWIDRRTTDGNILASDGRNALVK